MARFGDPRSGDKARSGDKVRVAARDGEGSAGLASRAGTAGSSADGRIGESLPGAMRRGETNWKRQAVELTAELAAGARAGVEGVRVRRLRGDAPEWSMVGRKSSPISTSQSTDKSGPNSL